ncbi:hypothetical protein PVAND_001867 [Polypedilum vanderplanki]|uniref:DUF4781 domain-containing protein n=1 Tax=Polypedilum vanderplanki TaxID=319348 RepID=A0A9J6BPN5_POLVA|nr:hypothetical protein PVAND_001867 [Polypedilum vanderplanki]
MTPQVLGRLLKIEKRFTELENHPLKPLLSYTPERSIVSLKFIKNILLIFYEIGIFGESEFVKNPPENISNKILQSRTKICEFITKNINWFSNYIPAYARKEIDFIDLSSKEAVYRVRSGVEFLLTDFQGISPEFDETLKLLKELSSIEDEFDSILNHWIESGLHYPLKEDKWITVAHENIARYMDRGGDDQGDVAELLEGSQLLNTIGIALNVHFSDPSTWTEEELEQAEDGRLCFFKDESRKAIDIVVNKIIEECKGNERNYITVLPIQLYSEGKLYSLSIFRFRARVDKKWKFVDNVGRVYTSFDDWKQNNVLPPGKVLYPLNGHLQRNSCGYVQTRCKHTPFGSSTSKFMKSADLGTGLIGIAGAVGTLFLSGGAALPFVVAGVGSAIYTTVRSSYHLIDRGTHGQTLNPFDSHENFSLWLGIGANLISFGAMGATVRLSTLAFQGKNVTQGFKLLVNLINGTSLTVNSIAVANSLAYMAIHFEEMTPVDVLMQVASVAFWAKSIFSYKPAAKMVKEIHNQVLQGYSTALGKGEAESFNKFRHKFNNDKQLVKFYFRYLKQGLDPAQVSDVLVEIYQMGASSKFFTVDPGQMSVCINGHTFTMEFLMCIKSCNRQTVFTVLSQLKDEETEVFNKLRGQIQDDIALFYLIAEVSKEFDLKPEESTNGLINFWRSIENLRKAKSPLTIKLNKDGSITIGNGHTFTLLEVVKFSSDDCILDVINKLLKLDHEDSIRFNHIRLVFDDDYELFKWIADADKMTSDNFIEALLELKSNELEDLDVFELASLEKNSIDECGIMKINNINLSIFFLAQMEPKLLNETIMMARYTEEENDILKGFHERVGHYRITSEFDRKKAKEWFEKLTKNHTRMMARFNNFRPHELSHMHRIKSILNRFELTTQQAIIDFAFTLAPKNILELISCCHFTCSFMNNLMEKFSVETFRSEKTKSEFESIRAWREEKSLNEFKTNVKAIKLEFAKLKIIATRNRMFDSKPLVVKDSLPDKDLVKAIISKVRFNEQLKFNSDTRAIAQIYRRSKSDMRKFVDRANAVVKDPKSKVNVCRGQEGVVRLIEFVNVDGKVEVIEKFGELFLNFFIEYDNK